MGHFGERVIGHRKAAEQAEVAEKRADHFGSRVIGDVLAKRRLEARTDEGAQRFKPKKDTRSKPGAKKEKAAAKKAAEEKAEVIEAPITSNVEELQSALEGNPAFYDQLYEAEFLRPSGPRKSALRLFLKHEMEHLDRDDRKAEIEAALAPTK
jgi:hypothetical protein